MSRHTNQATPTTTTHQPIAHHHAAFQWGKITVAGWGVIIVAGQGSPLRIIPLPHLVVLKLYAGGLKSLTDIVEVLSLNEDADLDAIDALCKRYRIQGFAKIREELENR